MSAPRAIGPPMPAAGATSAAPSTSGTSSGADDEGSSTGPASPPTNPMFSHGARAARARLRSPDGGGGSSSDGDGDASSSQSCASHEPENDGRRVVNAQLELLNGKLGLLGEGRRGEIFRGILDDGSGSPRRVAVKAFKRGGASMSWSPALLRLAENAGERHPHVCSVLRRCEAGGQLFEVRELCEDGQLLDRCLDGPIPELRALAYFAQAAAGVAHCHLRGCVNGQLRPEHLLLHADAVKLLGFRPTSWHPAPSAAAAWKRGQRIASALDIVAASSASGSAGGSAAGGSGLDGSSGGASEKNSGGSSEDDDASAASTRARSAAASPWLDAPKEPLARSTESPVSSSARIVLRIGRPLDAPELAGLSAAPPSALAAADIWALGVLLVWMVAGEAPRPAAGGGIALPAAFKEHASDGVRALANRLLRAEAERRPAAPRVVDDAARLLRKQPPAPEGSTSIDSTRRDASNTSSMDDMSSTDVARALRIASA